MTAHLPEPTTGKNGRGASRTSVREGEGRASRLLFTGNSLRRSTQLREFTVVSSTARYLGWGIEALKACEYDRKQDKTSRESKRNLTLFWQLSHKDHCEGMQSNALNVKDHQRFVRKNQSRMGRINMQRVKNGQISAWVCWRASFAPLFGSVCENFLNGSGHGTCEQVVNKPGGRLDERYYFTFVCILL